MTEQNNPLIIGRNPDYPSHPLYLLLESFPDVNWSFDGEGEARTALFDMTTDFCVVRTFISVSPPKQFDEEQVPWWVVKITEFEEDGETLFNENLLKLSFQMERPDPTPLVKSVFQSLRGAHGEDHHINEVFVELGLVPC